jgi:O-antigen/teichoic acid export membrane protein
MQSHFLRPLPTNYFPLSKIRQLAGETLVYGVGTIVPRLLNYLLLTPFYTRIFETGEYGIFTELYSYVAFLTVLLTYGMETTYFRFSGREDPGKVFHTSLISLLFSSSIFAFAGMWFASGIAGAIGYLEHPEYVRMFVGIVAIDAILSIPFARLRNQNRALWFSSLKLINLGLNIGLNVFFLVICPKIYATNPDSIWLHFYSPGVGVGYAFIANLITSVITAILLLPEMRIHRAGFDLSLLKRMLSYAWPLLLVGLSGMINDVADKIFLKHLIDDPIVAAQQVGIYGANYKLAMLMTLFTQVFRFAADPFFFRQANDANRNQTYAEVTRWFVITGLFIFLGVMLFMDVIRFFIGPNFHEGLGIVPIVLMANLFYGITYNLSFWYKISGRTIFGAYITGIGAFITVFLNVLLIPRFGYHGAAWTTLACYFVMMTVSYLWGQKFLRVDYSLGRLLFYFLLTLGLYGFSIKLPSMALGFSLSANAALILVFVAVVLVREIGVSSLKKRFGH